MIFCQIFVSRQGKGQAILLINMAYKIYLSRWQTTKNLGSFCIKKKEESVQALKIQRRLSILPTKTKILLILAKQSSKAEIKLFP